MIETGDGAIRFRSLFERNSVARLRNLLGLVTANSSRLLFDQACENRFASKFWCVSDEPHCSFR